MYLDQGEENLGVRPKLIQMVILFLENGEYAMIIVPLKRQKLVGLYKNQILYKSKNCFLHKIAYEHLCIAQKIAKKITHH